MIDIALPADLETIEVGIRLGRDVTRRDSMVALRISGKEDTHEIRGWPVYPPLGVPAKYVALGSKNEVQKFATIDATSIAGHSLTVQVVTDEGRPLAVASVALVGKSTENKVYAWKFEVNNG